MARIAITGGTGFVGLHTARALVAAGHEVRLVARGRRSTVRPPGVQFARADVVGGAGLGEALQGCDAVVSLTAVINQRGAQTFDNVNRKGVENVGKAAREAGVKHIVHVSALGADPDPAYPYLFSKWSGEQAIIESGVPYDVLRPSLMFGVGDGFFTRLVKVIRWNPVTPVPGDGTTAFQPFAVVDLARIVVQLIAGGPQRLVAEVGGPEWMTLDEIIATIKGVMGTRRPSVHVPVMALLPPAVIMAKLLPNPPLTPDQLKMLQRRNTTHPQAVQRQFGFTPMSFRDNAEYLQDY